MMLVLFAQVLVVLKAQKDLVWVCVVRVENATKLFSQT